MEIDINKILSNTQSECNRVCNALYDFLALVEKYPFTLQNENGTGCPGEYRIEQCLETLDWIFDSKWYIEEEEDK